MKKSDILIVEDSFTQAEILKYLLESNNYTVLHARNALEALEILETTKPDLIISDIVMPEMNGFELCKRIKNSEDKKNIPVILLTSLSNSEDVIEGLFCGADHFLTKPYNKEYLLDLISKVRKNYVIKNIKVENIDKRVDDVEIEVKGEKRIINFDLKQMLTLLISTYEAALNKNRELLNFQEDLKVFNENLEAIVQERTIELVTEIKSRKKAQDDLKQKNEEIEAQNAELKLAKEKAEESDRLKSAFLTNMSHEIRTPMNGILGFTSLLKEQDLSGEDQKEFLEIIERSGDRMLNTINAIIDISKIESGQVKLFYSDTNIHQQNENLLKLFKLEADRAGINIKYKNINYTNDLIVKTDQDKFFHVMSNLIKNAIKYSTEGTIEFGYQNKQYNDKEYLEFFVKDEGIGIPQNRQEAIFERFVQADIDDRFALEGNGLGLSISKAYVEMLGGEIWVESETDTGSAFYFTIPLNNDKPDAQINNLKFNNKKAINIQRKLKILIVEDEEYSSKHLSILLNEYAREILHAGSGKQAVEKCQNNSDIDLILMDLKMPEMNGYEATKIIRKIYPDVIIIAQTAFALSGDKEEVMKANFSDYISKPINKENLLEKIDYFFSK